MTKISFQGEHGAYSESAARKFHRDEIETSPCNTFEDALKNTEDGESEFSILPVENSIEGTVGQSIDAITNTKLNAIGEIFLKIEHCLIGTGKLNDIDTVYSHPQALGQCSEFIHKNNFKTVPTYDTAGSVKIIKEIGKNNCASIASKFASSLYDVPIIKQGIENNSNNYTRFLVFSKDQNSVIGNNDKTSIIFSVKHEPGALFQILKEFQNNSINLTKIESRPNKNTNWEYNFFVDMVGHKGDSRINSVLENIAKETLFLKVIGSYPIADLD
tara:strand:+ start:4815 stop:5633 length:819 start_codon:yes stop_codon:yes gene_type:complete